MQGLIRILIADDHEAVREGLAAVLTPRAGFEVVAQARDGREAAALYRTHYPDITLMDLRMPRVGGLEATQNILTDFPEARIIVLTAFSGEGENSLRAGAKAVLLKDAPREELHRVIREQSAEDLPSLHGQRPSLASATPSTAAQLDTVLSGDTPAAMHGPRIVAGDRAAPPSPDPAAERLKG